MAPPPLRRDDGPGSGGGDIRTDGVGIVAAVSQEHLDPLVDHPEQHGEALEIVGLSRRHDEAERQSAGVAARVQLGGEAAARAAERLSRPSSFFMPAAQ